MSFICRLNKPQMWVFVHACTVRLLGAKIYLTLFLMIFKMFKYFRDITYMLVYFDLLARSFLICCIFQPTTDVYFTLEWWTMRRVKLCEPMYVVCECVILFFYYQCVIQVNLCTFGQLHNFFPTPTFDCVTKEPLLMFFGIFLWMHLTNRINWTL